MQEKQIDRYTAIVVVSRRARQIIDGVPSVVEGSSTKPVTIAIEELDAGKIQWKSNKPV